MTSTALKKIAANCLSFIFVASLMPFASANASSRRDLSLNAQTENSQNQETQTSDEQSSALQSKAEEYDRLFDLALRVMRHKELYDRLNKGLKESLILNEQNQTGVFGSDINPSAQSAAQVSSPNTSVPSTPTEPTNFKQLSMSQIVFLLQNIPSYIPTIEAYMAEFPSGQKDETPEKKQRRKYYQALFDKALSTDSNVQTVIRNNSPSQPLTLKTSDGTPAFTSLKMFVNHPIFEKQKGKLVQRPADDLRKLVIDFISEADSEITYNVFDFDLKPVAEALVKAHSNGVSVLGGIDAGTIASRPEVKSIVEYLASNNIAPVEVDSVGLNHQKIIIRDPMGPKAAVLFLSGNFTQSCIGPEGDQVSASPETRSIFSIPNANHAILIEGTLPSIVARQELKKTLVYKLRGESQYPVGGAYQMYGPIDPATKKASIIVMTFSPNGGMGDINRDILARLIRQTTGPLEAVQFAFSSPLVQKSIVEKIQRETSRAKAAGKSIDPSTLFRSVGDTPFALREWSGFLYMSGLKKNLETMKYEADASFPLANQMLPEELQRWKSNIRVAPARYGERHITLQDGSSFKITSKIHHKIWNVPRQQIAVVGTSFNTSEGAETNNEQLLIVKDSVISAKTSGLIEWLFRKSEASVSVVAQKRNLRPTQETGNEDSEQEEKIAVPKSK